MPQDVLHFIVSDGPRLQDDAGTRTLIRKQAMKNVALQRKKRGNYGRVNLGQLPMLPLNTHSQTSNTNSLAVESDAHTSNLNTQNSNELDLNTAQPKRSQVVGKSKAKATLQDRSQSQDTMLNPPIYFTPIGPLSDYEIARSKFDVDITDLAMLTNFNVGRSTIRALAADPSRLYSLLGHSHWSYLEFVPSYYGLSECVTTATDCLLARVRRLLMPQTCHAGLELRLYTRALRKLQCVLQDASKCMQADVLCATQLLSLHELLSSSDDTAWSHHVRGSARLIQHRTSSRFKSEFEKALFAAHVGPTVVGCLVGDEHCYLEDPRWMKLYRSLAQPSDRLNDRSPLTINLRSQMIVLPGLWCDMEQALLGPNLFDEAVMATYELQCRHLHDQYLESMGQYKEYCARSSLSAPSYQELTTRRELLGMTLECLAVTKRLVAVTCDDERIVLEAEAQTLANATLDLQKQPSANHTWLFSQSEIHVAQTITRSREKWEEDCTYLSDYERKMAIRERYIEWKALLRA